MSLKKQLEAWKAAFNPNHVLPKSMLSIQCQHDDLMEALEEAVEIIEIACEMDKSALGNYFSLEKSWPARWLKKWGFYT